MARNILRLPVVLSRVGASRSSVYLWISEGHFPPPIPLGERSVGWIEDEIEAWIEDRIQASRKKNQ